jgi:hypothetical protein
MVDLEALFWGFAHRYFIGFSLLKLRSQEATLTVT